MKLTTKMIVVFLGQSTCLLLLLLLLFNSILRVHWHVKDITWMGHLKQSNVRIGSKLGAIRVTRQKA